MRLFIILSLFIAPVFSNAQGQMLLLKKKGKVFRSYFPGSVIFYDDGFGLQRAHVDRMRNDSLFLVQYQVNRVMTPSGFPFLDTLGTYSFAVSINDIRTMAEEKHGWDWQTSGAALFGGGAVLTTGGLLTWVFSKKNTRYYARPEFVITSAALTGIGFMLMRISPSHKWRLGKKYTLQYISSQ